jgi:hypothetical protein
MTDTPKPKKRRGRPPKKKAEPVVEFDATADGKITPTARVIKDPLENKLDHFQYRASDHDLDVWQHTDISPMHVPKAIKDKYPDLRFRYVSKARWRGNDNFLAAMPEKRALAYNKAVSQRSREKIRDLQESHVENAAAMERAGIEPLGDGLVIATKEKRAGYNRQELMEIVRRNREEHNKKRKYFLT